MLARVARRMERSLLSRTGIFGSPLCTPLPFTHLFKWYFIIIILLLEGIRHYWFNMKFYFKL